MVCPPYRRQPITARDIRVESPANGWPRAPARRTMNWLASIFVGLCAAVLTAFIVATGADSWARWLRIGSHEGASAYWVVMVALLAAIAGLIVGICIARGWLLSTPGF